MTSQHTTQLRPNPEQMLAQTLRAWREQGAGDLWLFGYASLIWRPEIGFSERRAAKVFGWHRALHMWSHINRGTPECPGLVFALLRGGSCQGVAFRLPAHQVKDSLSQLWLREMPNSVYDPSWLNCHTAHGQIQALAFTLSHSSPSYTGHLNPAQYRQIFSASCGRYGTTLAYARATYDSLLQEGIEDKALAKLLQLAPS